MLIYFDNDFFNIRLTQLDPIDLSMQLTKMDLRWCFSEELLLELIESVHRRDNAEQEKMLKKMSSWARFCLELLPDSKIFRNYARIIIDEARGNGVDPFKSGPDEEKLKKEIKKLLGPLSEERLPEKIQEVWETCQKRKVGDENFRQGIKERCERGANNRDFEDFALHYLKARYKDDGVEDADGKAEQTLLILSNFPFLKTFMMAAYRLSYEWTGRDRGFDLRHLVYANGADWFITNDGGLRELANQIFSSNPRVLSQDDFLKRAGVANSTPIERGSIVQYTRS